MREGGDETARLAHGSSVAASIASWSPAGAGGQGCCCVLKARQMRMGTLWSHGRPAMADHTSRGGVPLQGGCEGRGCLQNLCIMKVCII